MHENNFILNNILENYENYNNTKNMLEETILKDLDNKNLECSLDINGEIYEMTLGNFWTLLILTRPFVEFGILFTEEFLVDVSDLNEISNYFNIVIENFTEEGIDASECLLDVLSELAITSSKVLGKYGATINLYDICQLMKRNKEFRNLIEFNFKKLNKNLEFEEMNHILDENLKKLLDILTTEENCFKYLILSKSGVSERQLREVLVSIGPKPMGNGTIISEPVDTSYIKGQSPFDFLVDAYGGRTALLLNFRNTKESGYLTRKLTLLCMDNIIRKDIDDCGTKQTIETFIEDKNTLNKLKYRNYIGEDNKLHIIKPSEDEDLIGKTIKLRSPIKCACTDGVCKTCYGNLWKYNINRNVGIVGTLLLTNPLTQLNLSAKHNIQARADKIDWSDKFLEYFAVNKDQILLNTNNNIKIIIHEFIENEDDFETNFEFNQFQVDNGKELINISVPIDLIVNDELIDIEDCYDNKEECYIIESKEFMETDILFTYIMKNNELTASLNAITNLIETNFFIKEHSIDESYNEFIRLLNNSPIGINFVHIELILKELCKIKDNDRTLFAKSEESPIEEIYRVTEALIKNPCLSKSIVYQELYKQLTQMLDTFSKDKKSIIDTLLK